MTDEDLRSRLPYRPCVGMAVFNAAGAVFIGRRVGMAADDPHAWQMPQGGIDEDEDPHTAAIRELFEETGMRSIELIAEAPEWLNYDIPAGSKKKWLNKFRGQTQMWLAFRFLGDEAEIRLDMHGAPEFERWRWADLSETPELVVPFKRHVYEDVVRFFGHIQDSSLT